MTWLAVILGIALTAFGATAGAALITVSRAELTRAVGRRLRGAAASLSGLTQIDYYLTAASATTSLGVLLLGAAIPGLPRTPLADSASGRNGGRAGNSHSPPLVPHSWPGTPSPHGYPADRSPLYLAGGGSGRHRG